MTKMEMIRKIDELSMRAYGCRTFYGFDCLYRKTKDELERIIRFDESVVAEKEAKARG